MNFRDLLNKIVERNNLTEGEAESIADDIMKGNLNDILTSAVLVSLRTKGESSEEIAGFAKSMRNHAIKVSLGNALDTAGTGGDGFGTINVSTISAILVSQIYPVAKHGNRAASSKSGSADFLETIGYNISVTPEKAIELISKSNFVFLFAQLYHPAMKNVANVRKTLGIRTIFNLLGPLTNPALVKRQVMGIFSEDYMLKVAEAAVKLDYEKLVMVNGYPGLDEVSPIGRTTIYEISHNKVEKYTEDFTEIIKTEVKLDDLIVKDSVESAIKILRGLKGKDRAVNEFIKVNSAVALYAAGVVKDYKDGYEYSSQLISTSIDKLREIISINGDLNKFNQILAKADGN
ncbi:anthranilate phosphoribosyltransferase [Acidianus sulfidivorans JP7]|uniref:Anthranilate phosphoribosyltransferase n=1 Tax=Acidianus sulfidivorans JP7 TaxID=619593 RepID=A0A2U9IP56_9CREN|nr:anthranilate phosphoribosyltransferase [Acidianus sulfidivorans]AWR97764.1 anthranilate phosphoribosyltransferase [Acidianus sulfidivorans JP7]